MKRTVYLVDVSSMFFRAFYAIRPLTNSKGLPTNAIYGFLSMTVKLLKDRKPEYIAYCLDSKEPSFRKEIDSNYKANRTEMPEDLEKQIPYILKIAEALGIRSIGFPGYEADDIIGTLAAKARKDDCDVVIVSGDKDFAQLISPHVTMQDTMKELVFNPEEVKKKWGVSPEQFRDYLAIVGDTSDNVPGVAGIGPKGAVKLLEEFGSLDSIYDSLDKIASKSVREKLEASREQAFRAQKLVTIFCDMDIPATVDDLRLQPQRTDEVSSLLSDLEFKTFDRLLAGAPNAPNQASSGSAPSASSSSKSSLSTSDSEDSTVGAAAATQSSDVSQRQGDGSANPARSVSRPKKVEDLEEAEVSLSEFLRIIPDNAEVWLIPVGAAFVLGFGRTVYRIRDDLATWRDHLSGRPIKWCGYDLKSCWRAIHITGPVADFDCMLAIYVLRPQEVRDFPTEYAEYCGETLDPMLSATQMYQAMLHLAEILLEKLPQIQAQKILEDIELPVMPILYDMEERGVLVDVDLLRTQSSEMREQISGIETDIYELAGEVFNIGSPKQLGRILFEKLKLPVQRKTKTGYSTDNEVLETLARVHPICERIVEYRELTKLKSTYVDALPALVNPVTGRIHTTFNQALTSTGRLSSSHPNLQNIPIRTERGQRIRQAFIAAKGTELVSADYSQIELRILAHITNDNGLINAFREDLDIHQATASEIFGVKLTEVTPDLRRTAKAVNFGIAYGQSAFGLAQTLGIPRGEAQDIIERYFKRFKGVAEYMQTTIEQAKNRGFVETLFGRRRYLPELRSSQQGIRRFGERAAINAPIQGTASDLVKMAMIRAYQEPRLKAMNLHMTLQVHDELVFEVETEKIAIASPIIEECMTSVFPMRVPLKVNVGHGLNWEQAH
jgi:DNA polymerase-1